MLKSELVALIADLKDDDEIIIGVIEPSEEDASGFSETDTATAKPAENADDEETVNYVEYPVDSAEIVDAEDGSGKALLLYVDLESGDEEGDGEDAEPADA